MVKLGVWKPQQFFTVPPRTGAHYIYYRLSRSRVSFRLLLHAAEHTEDTALFERLMRHIRLSNGVCRTTFERRFDQLDSIVNRILIHSFPSQEPLRVEDWAASACLASCRWAEALFLSFPQARFIASDLALTLVRRSDFERCLHR